MCTYNNSQFFVSRYSTIDLPSPQQTLMLSCFSALCFVMPFLPVSNYPSPSFLTSHHMKIATRIQYHPFHTVYLSTYY